MVIIHKKLSIIKKDAKKFVDKWKGKGREMLKAVKLKDRKNFLQYSLNPAINSGFVQMLHPERPNHPRQKYLLTVKGLAFYQELKNNKDNK